MGDGRFGPLFGARDADGRRVVIRSFAELSLDDEQRARFIAALESLCEHPLEHPSIARPIACGLAKGRPYLVHSRLPGRDLVEATALTGTPNVADLVLRLTWVAGALDFAAATGVFHGTLTARDIIVSDDNAGVSGLGIAQALARAGVPGVEATRDADIQALARIAGELCGEDALPAVRRVLDDFRPESALEFAEALHAAVWRPDGEHGEVTVRTDAGPSPADADILRPATSDLDDRFTPIDAPHGMDVPLHVATNAGLDFVPEHESVAGAPDVASGIGRGLSASPYESDASDAGRGVSSSGQDLGAQNLGAQDLGVGRGLSASPFRHESSFGAATHAPAMFASVPTRRRSRGWLLTGVVALALGVFVGFAGGFFVGREAPAIENVGTPPPPEPEATGGQTNTDSPVDASPNATTPGAPGQESAGPSTPADTSAPSPAGVTPVAPGTSTPSNGAAPADTTPATPDGAAAATSSTTPDRPSARAQAAPTPPSGPAAMRIESLPAGAQVFVDGQSVGYAPLVVGQLTPGTHSIRMQLPGYRPWVSAVTLAPGARERVAASLEQ